MNKYVVTFTRYGFAIVEANSELEAIRKADGFSLDDIDWSDLFEATDAKDEES